MIIGGRESSYVIVTNGFSSVPGNGDGQTGLEWQHISGLAASSEPVLLWNYYVESFLR